MKKRNLFNNLLLLLTMFDTVFIVNGGISFMYRVFRFRNELFEMVFPHVIYPLAGIAMTGKTSSESHTVTTKKPPLFTKRYFVY